MVFAYSKPDAYGVSGIGVDDMFLLMSSWSENLPSDVQEQTVQHVPKILGKTLATAGIGITITSLTDFLAFVIGTTSVFMSVTNFSLYAGEYFIIIGITTTTIAVTSLTDFLAFVIGNTSVFMSVTNIFVYAGEYFVSPSISSSLSSLSLPPSLTS